MTKTERIREILDTIAHQLHSPQELDRVLYHIAQETVEHLGAACCRVWLIRRGDICSTCHWSSVCSDKRRCLHLKASCGAPIEPEFRRAPLDVFNHETIARGGIADWSGPAPEFEILMDQGWAAQQKLVSFATQPLRVENRVLGLMAIFSQKLIYPADYKEMAAFAACAATAIRVAEMTARISRAEAGTQEKQRELQQTTTLLNAILNSSTDQAIIVEDLEGNILAFNEGAHRMYGYAPEEVIGKANSEKLYAPQDRAAGRIMDLFKQTIEQGRVEGTFQRMRKNGELFLEKTTLTVHRDEEGDPAGFVIVARDLTRDETPTPQTVRLTTALEALPAARRPELLATEILKQMTGLLPTQEGVLFLIEDGYLAARSVAGFDDARTLTEIRFSAADAPNLHRTLYETRACEVTDDILPSDSPLARASRVTTTTPRWVFPLHHEGPLGLILLSPRSGTRYEEAQVTVGTRFANLAAQFLGQAVATETIGEQLRLLQGRYAALESEHKTLVEQSADLQLSRAQLLERSGSIEADLVRVSGRHQQLAQETIELQSYANNLEETLRVTREKLTAAQATIETLRPAAERSADLEKRLRETEKSSSQLRENLAEAEIHYEQSYRRAMDRNAQLETSLAQLQQEQRERDNRLRLLEEQEAIRSQRAAGDPQIDAERAVWQATVARLERELAAAEARSTEFQARTRQIEANLAQALEQRNESRTALDRAKQETAQVLAALESAQNDIAALQTTMKATHVEEVRLKTEVTGQNERLRKEYAELEERHLHLDAEAKLLRADLGRLQDMVAPYRDLQVKCLQLEQSEQTLTERLQAVRQDFEKVEAERIRLEADNRQLVDQVAAIEAAVEAERAARRVETDAQRTETENQLSALKRRVEELTDIQVEFRELSAQHLQTLDLVAGSRDELTAGHAILDALVNGFRNAGLHISRVRDVLAGVRAGWARSLARVRELETELAARREESANETIAWKNQAEELATALGAREVQFDALALTLGAARNEAAAAIERATNLATALSAREATIAALHLSLGAARNEAATAVERATNLATTLSAREATIAALQLNLGTARNEVQNLIGWVQDLSAKLSNRNAVVAALEMDLGAARAEILHLADGNERLTGLVAQREAELDEAAVEIERRTLPLVELTQTIQEREAALTHMGISLENARRDAAQLADQVGELSATLSGRELALAVSELELNTARNDVRHTQDAIRRLESILFERDLEIAAFRNSITDTIARHEQETRERSSVIADLTERLTAFQSGFAALEAERLTLDRLVETLTDRGNRLALDLDQKSADLTAAEATIAALETRLRTEEAALATERETKRDLSETLHQTRQELDSAVRERQALAEAVQHLATVTAEVQDLRRECETLRRATAEERSARAAAETVAAEVGRLRAENQQVSDRIETLAGQNLALRRRVEQRDETRNALIEELAAFAAKDRRRNEYIRYLELRISELETERSEWKRLLDDTRPGRERKSGEIEALQARLAELADNLDAAVEGHRHREDVIARLEERVAALMAERTTWQSLVDSAAAREATGVEERTALQTELAAARALCQTLQTERETLLGRLAGAGEQTPEQIQGVFESVRLELEAQRDLAAEQRTAAEAELARVMESLRDAEARCADLESRIARQSEEHQTTLETIRDNNRQQREFLEEQIAETQAAYAALQAKYEANAAVNAAPADSAVPAEVSNEAPPPSDTPALQRDPRSPQAFRRQGTSYGKRTGKTPRHTAGFEVLPETMTAAEMLERELPKEAPPPPPSFRPLPETQTAADLLHRETPRESPPEPPISLPESQTAGALLRAIPDTPPTKEIVAVPESKDAANLLSQFKPPARKRRRAVSASTQPRVMFVSDRPDSAWFQEVLAKGGYRIEAFSDQELALATAAAECPDLLLVNINPESDNALPPTELLQAIRRNQATRRLPVVLVLPPASEGGGFPIQSDKVRSLLRNILTEEGLLSALEELCPR